MRKKLCCAYLPYRSLPVEQFKITHKFSDPFWGPPGVLKPFKTLVRLFDRTHHRKYVGRAAGSGQPFQECCRFQLDFMKQRSLSPADTLLDLGCGSLRGGIHFIRYLQSERYLGLDISAEVVRRGICRELGAEYFHDRKPEFVISESFEFHAFSKRPRFAIANSVFTHLPPNEIKSCLTRLRTFIGESEAELFATFTEVDAVSQHSGAPHYLGGKDRLTYTRDEMHELGRATSWNTEYIGVWGHPKNQWQGDTKQQRMFRFSSR